MKYILDQNTGLREERQIGLREGIELRNARDTEKYSKENA